MAKLPKDEWWPDTEITPSEPLTEKERSEHRRSIVILFGGSAVGYVMLAYLIGAPPLRRAVTQAWSGVLALIQALW